MAACCWNMRLRQSLFSMMVHFGILGSPHIPCLEALANANPSTTGVYNDRCYYNWQKSGMGKELTKDKIFTHTHKRTECEAKHFSAIYINEINENGLTG